MVWSFLLVNMSREDFIYLYNTEDKNHSLFGLLRLFFCNSRLYFIVAFFLKYGYKLCCIGAFCFDCIMGKASSETRKKQYGDYDSDYVLCGKCIVNNIVMHVRVTITE